MTQGKELPAFIRHWECISSTSKYFYKSVVESFHTLGFEETAVVDMSGITNCWLSNTWKQFWASSFNYNSIFEYPDDMVGKILHPKVDSAIVRLDLQLPVAEMIGHLMYLMTVLNIQVTWPFSFATLLLLCNQVPSATDLSSGVDPATRAALATDFCLGWGATWSLLAPMRNSFQFATDLVTELANNQLRDQLGWTFKKFRL